MGKRINNIVTAAALTASTLAAGCAPSTQVRQIGGMEYKMSRLDWRNPNDGRTILYAYNTKAGETIKYEFNTVGHTPRIEDGELYKVTITDSTGTHTLSSENQKDMAKIREYHRRLREDVRKFNEAEPTKQEKLPVKKRFGKIEA